ncbi:MAG: zinc ABC transporter substrate-binding protein, partial [Planctomycetota bacterium]|nr:zinc ABC transporter substrate-binding protein [Planctomycetota bacterium]
MFHWLFAGLLLAATLTGCQAEAAPQKANDKPQILATVGMLADVVTVVAGDRADVVAMMGPGVDPHLHKPTRRDVRALASADAIFYVGLTLEGRMADALERLRLSGRHVVAVGEAIPSDLLRHPDEFEGHPDPHIWMDVRLWSRSVDRIATSLAEFDPEGAETYRRNAIAYRRELRGLDDYVRQVVATIPSRQRQLVTAHDAFGYFSRAYDIPVHSVQGITTESEAGLADITGLVDFLVTNDVPAIFIETSLSPRNLQAVLAGVEARGAS